MVKVDCSIFRPSKSRWWKRIRLDARSLHKWLRQLLRSWPVWIKFRHRLLPVSAYYLVAQNCVHPIKCSLKMTFLRKWVSDGFLYFHRCDSGYTGTQCEEIADFNILYVVPSGQKLHYVLIAAIIGAVQIAIIVAVVMCITRWVLVDLVDENLPKACINALS